MSELITDLEQMAGAIKYGEHDDIDPGQIRGLLRQAAERLTLLEGLLTYPARLKYTRKGEYATVTIKMDIDTGTLRDLMSLFEG